MNKITRMRKLWVIAATCLCVSRQVSAETETPTPDPHGQHSAGEIVVNSTPLPQTLFESAQPISALDEHTIELRGGGNIGELLATEPGVSNSYFGPGASRPVIRGIGGERIRILENGLGSQDLSSLSSDHLVTVDPLVVDRVEVVRGPAALLYGTSAVGGAVNVFDNRIPEKLPKKNLAAKAEFNTSSVDEGLSGATVVDGKFENLAFHVDGSAKETDDIKIPGFARTQNARQSSELEFPEPRGTLPYSAVDTHNLSAGSSYLFGRGFVGASVSQFESVYGVPNGEKDVSIDATRTRYDLRAKLIDPLPRIANLSLKLGASEYQHTEFEGVETGTVFENDGLDGRLEFTHDRISQFEGVAGIQFQRSDFAAIGAEAFQLPTISEIASLFAFEEYTLNQNWKFQGGIRTDFHALDTDEIDRDFSTLSESLGAVYSFDSDYAAAFSLAHTERAPTGQELFADGPHIATAAYEIGDANLDPERSLGVDLHLRKNSGRFTGTIGAFYNHFFDYIALNPTGEMSETEHNEEAEHEEEEEHDHGALPIYRYQSTAAQFYGIESQLAYHILQDEARDLSIDFQPDYVYARDKNTGQPLPRITPLRLKFGINYRLGQEFDSRLELLHVLRQNRNALFETETPDYSQLNLFLSRKFQGLGQIVELYLRGTNLLNQKSRDHVSFIKDVAPLPGINLIAGLKVSF